MTSPRMLLGLVSVGALSASCALTFTDYPVGRGSSSSSGPGGGGCTPPDGAILAIDQLLLGDRDPDGTTSSTAWKQYGRDIDGQDTTTDFGMHCLPNANGSPGTAFPDGNAGIDNSFGHNVLPILEELAPTVSDEVNANIASGNNGFLFDLVDLGSGPNQTSITTRFYSGAPLAGGPAFDGSDCWPVEGDSVTDPGDVTTAKVVFHDGSLASNLWTTGPPATVDLTLVVFGSAVTVTLHRAVAQALLADDHRSTVFGEISGILDTEEFVSVVERAASAVNPGLCSTQELASIVNRIRQSSDIMTDGTQNPQTEVCSGISVGFGFTAKAVMLGGVSPSSTPPAMSCP